MYFTGTLYWITGVMAKYGDMASWVAVPINALLVLYQAAFVAVFALVLRRIVVKHGFLALMAAPVVWVATELGRTHFLTGFPWVLLGYSQTSVLPIVQFASIFGVYGVSMLVASVSAAVAVYAAARMTGRAETRHHIPAVTVLAVIIVVAVWGGRRAAAAEWTHTGDAIRIGLIQGNVDQDEKAQAGRAAAIFQDYLRMTRQAIARRRRVGHLARIVDAVPLRGRSAGAGADAHAGAAGARADPVRQRSVRCAAPSGAPTTFYNSAFLVRPDGTTGGVYRKMHLVPFGEYVPAQAAALLRGAAGARRCPISPPAKRRRCCRSAGICSARRSATRSSIRISCADSCGGGSELLTTITNDAWFGPTSAPYQHFEQASMRAIEEGRYLVRSANTGISGIVDPYGRVLARDGHLSSRRCSSARRGSCRRRRSTRGIGDVFAYASVVVTAAALVLARRTYGSLSHEVGRPTAIRPCEPGLSVNMRVRHADRRRFDAPLRGSQQARCRSAELSLRPPGPTKN